MDYKLMFVIWAIGFLWQSTNDESHDVERLIYWVLGTISLILAAIW